MSSCPQAEDCDKADDCQHATNGAGVEDIEDYKTELSTLRARTKELEEKLAKLTTSSDKTLRSSKWLNRVDDKAMSALYLDRYLNYGLTKEELMSDRPIIGIANSGSDLAPCNRHHLTLAKRVREGIRSAGGIAIEFPTYVLSWVPHATETETNYTSDIPYKKVHVVRQQRWIAT